MTLIQESEEKIKQRINNLVPPSLAFPTRVLEPGDLLYEEGREAKFLYLVRAGILKAIVPTSLGRERIVDLYGPGDILGFAALNGPQHVETVIALNTSTLVPLEPRYVLADERLSHYILASLAVQLRRSREAIAESDLPVGARIARLFQYLSERFGEELGVGEVSLPIALTHEDIASLAQSSRVTVTRVLGELRSEKAVTGTRGSYVTHPQALEAAAEHYVLQVL